LLEDFPLSNLHLSAALKGSGVWIPANEFIITAYLIKNHPQREPELTAIWHKRDNDPHTPWQ